MERIVIPTYPAGEPDNNPMFLEKRVYQGSSGAAREVLRDLESGWEF